MKNYKLRKRDDIVTSYIYKFGEERISYPIEGICKILEINVSNLT